MVPTPDARVDDDVDNQIYKVHLRYDIIETDMRVLHKDDNINLLVKPQNLVNTKVILTVDGAADLRKEFIIENKSYRGGLQEEPATFRYEERDWGFELGF